MRPLAVAPLLALLAVGCASFGPGSPKTSCPVEWAPSGSIGAAAASLRARMRLRVGDEELRLELIAQSRDDELVVVGLAHYGVRLFAIHQRGIEVTVKGASSPELEQLALWVMDALHRVYWIGPGLGPAGDSENDSWRWARERVNQARAGGKLIREFALPDSDSATGRVTIEYPDPDAGEPTPGIAIRNPWCGYDALIVPVQTPSTRAR